LRDPRLIQSECASLFRGRNGIEYSVTELKIGPLPYLRIWKNRVEGEPTGGCGVTLRFGFVLSRHYSTFTREVL